MSSKKTAKASAAPKQSAMGKMIAARLQQQKEEEERLQKEEEERLRQEEEEDKKREAEIKRIEEEKIKEKEAKKKKAEDKKKAQDEQKRLKILAQLNQNNVVVKKVEAEDQHKKDAKKQDEKKDQKVENTITTTTTLPVVVQTPQPKQDKPVPDSWEEEDWENIDEDKLAASIAKVEVKAESAVSTTATAQPQQSKEEKAAETVDSKAEQEEELRSPICCVLGHVDTGKTSLLDYIRHSNVQKGEEGGITQQIGATWVPIDAIKEQTKHFKEKLTSNMKLPGLLIIDTPGHESFNNLRSRGSSLCDIAVLVVDIMHGLEPQTIESLNMLKARKTPFVVALNKVDRIYGWKKHSGMNFQDTLKKQDKQARQEFEQRTKDTITAFAEQGLNSCLYYENKDFKHYVSLIPTSAHSGEGVPDLLMLLVQITQRLMTSRLLYLSKLQATVLEVKMIDGLGTTVDAILVNGELHEGDTIVLCGMSGPIVTSIRALLTPQPLKEIRVKGTYQHHKLIKASQGVKIVGAHLEHAVAGSALLVHREGETDLEDLKREVMQDFEAMKQRISVTSQGVYVMASSLGSLEALIEYLKSVEVPVFGINIGPVHKKDVMKAAIMLDTKKEYATILAFDVKVTKEAEEVAADMNVKIFSAKIIYHLADRFKEYIDKINKASQDVAKAEAVFPCKLRIYPEYIFNQRNPIVLGVEVMEGTLKLGTPICVPAKEFVYLGKVSSIENNHKAVQEAKKGTSVSMKIEHTDDVEGGPKMFGRHFDEKDELVSKISRQSIDVLKQHFKGQVSKEDVQLLAKLKLVFKIE